jgi:hypothetical protein
MNLLLLTGVVAGASGAICGFFILLGSFPDAKKIRVEIERILDSLRRSDADHVNESDDVYIYESLKSDILAVFDDFMSDKLILKMPVLKMFIDDKLIAEIRAVFHEEMELHLPILLQKNFEKKDYFMLIESAMQKSIRHQRKRLAMIFFIVLLAGCVSGGLAGYIVSLCMQ